METLNYVPAMLGGRCANGHERGQGSVVHAVQQSGTRPDDLASTALCGQRAGARSVGFCLRDELIVNCPNCLRRLENPARKPKPLPSNAPLSTRQRQILESGATAVYVRGAWKWESGNSTATADSLLVNTSEVGARLPWQMTLGLKHLI
jgi:hypothetical protein